jgi:uncharacterized protein
VNALQPPGRSGFFVGAGKSGVARLGVAIHCHLEGQSSLPVAALIIWLVYRGRSQKVAFHALQSMWYQIGWLVILAVGWTVTALLLVVLIGIVLIPVMAIVSVVPFVHAAIAAYRVSKGEDYLYPFAADVVERH